MDQEPSAVIESPEDVLPVGPSLTPQDDMFALGVIEFGGNLAAAYKQAYPDEANPVAKARLAISRPEVARRIQYLTELTQEHAMISLGSHLQTLSEIRDLALTKGEFNVGLKAEVQRGTAAGLYKDKTTDPTDKARHVHIHMPNTPPTVEEWAKRQGVQSVIIDV